VLRGTSGDAEGVPEKSMLVGDGAGEAVEVCPEQRGDGGGSVG
jgi:hypothetical protein